MSASRLCIEQPGEVREAGITRSLGVADFVSDTALQPDVWRSVLPLQPHAAA